MKECSKAFVENTIDIRIRSVSTHFQTVLFHTCGPAAFTSGKQIVKNKLFIRRTFIRNCHCLVQ